MCAASSAFAAATRCFSSCAPSSFVRRRRSEISASRRACSRALRSSRSLATFSPRVVCARFEGCSDSGLGAGLGVIFGATDLSASRGCSPASPILLMLPDLTSGTWSGRTIFFWKSRLEEASHSCNQNITPPWDSLSSKPVFAPLWFVSLEAIFLNARLSPSPRSA